MNMLTTAPSTTYTTHAISTSLSTGLTPLTDSATAKEPNIEPSNILCFNPGLVTSIEDEDITFDLLAATTILDDDNDSLFHDSTVILDPTTVKELDAFCSKVNTDDIFDDAVAPTSEGEPQYENSYSYFKSMLMTFLALALSFYYHSMLTRLLVLTFSGGFIGSVIITLHSASRFL